MKGNLEADYFLFINGKAVGVLEAKREETDAFSDKVCNQAVLYARNVPKVYQTYQKPLPFIFTSNGKDLYFCDFRKQDSCFKQIMTIPTPHELVKLLGINDYFAGLPTLRKKDYVIVSMRLFLNWKKFQEWAKSRLDGIGNRCR